MSTPSRRQQRVEELIRRELADMLIRGELRDPRLEPNAAVSVTGVEVSPDLGNATVFVDVFSGQLKVEPALKALRSARASIRARLGQRVHLKRLPALHFEHDGSVARGARVAEILQDLAADRGADAPDPSQLGEEPREDGDDDDDGTLAG